MKIRRPIEKKYRRRKRRRFNKQLSHRPFYNKEVVEMTDQMSTSDKIREVREGMSEERRWEIRDKVSKEIKPLKKLQSRAAIPV